MSKPKIARKPTAAKKTTPPPAPASAPDLPEAGPELEGGLRFIYQQRVDINDRADEARRYIARLAVAGFWLGEGGIVPAATDVTMPAGYLAAFVNDATELALQLYDRVQELERERPSEPPVSTMRGAV